MVKRRLVITFLMGLIKKKLKQKKRDKVAMETIKMQKANLMQLASRKELKMTVSKVRSNHLTVTGRQTSLHCLLTFLKVCIVYMYMCPTEP